MNYNTKIKIDINGQPKTIWQDLATGQLFVNFAGIKHFCEIIDKDFVKVDFYGFASIV